MKTRTLNHNLFTLAVAAVALVAWSAQAQVTLPTPTTPNFDNNAGGGDGLWNTTTNWDTDAIPLNTEDAKINDGLSAFYDASGGGGALAFGTLTIGNGSTFQYDTDGGSATDFTDGNDIYFDNNATMIVDGFFNSALDLKVVGTGAIIDHNGQSRYRGTLEGAGSLEIQLNNWFAPRWDAGSFTGDLTFTTSTNTYLREIGNFTSTPFLGAGNNTIGSGIWVQHNRDNMVPTAATVTLVGAAGGDNIKWNSGADKGRETITNLVFDSPVAAATKAYMYFRNDLMEVTDTVTFTGTAGTVWIDSAFADPTSWPGGIDARGADVTFEGTGNWNITGDSRFWVDSGSTVTTDTNATIENGFYSTSGFTKAGAGTLTLGDVSGLGGAVTISAGTLETSGTSDGSVTLNGTGATFNHSGSGIVAVTEGAAFTGTLGADGGGTLELANGADFTGADVALSGGSKLEIGSGGTVGAATFDSLIVGADGAQLNLDLDSALSFDQITADLDFSSGGVLTINVRSDFKPLKGQEFTVFNNSTFAEGDIGNVSVIGDYGQFWAVEVGSLNLVSTIPEPSTMLLAGLGLLGIAFRRRRSA